MKNLSRNTAAVLVLTLFTGLAVFTAIQLGDRLFGTSSASAQTISAQAVQSQSGSNGSAGGSYYSDPYGQTGSSSGGGQTYTCPATGCTASTCHATQQ